ncbi:hypothetical protein I79_021224 [Cricetulus griseus]|uniref:Uncharacterized protein n=1 Tax=Cricetulus griseus TaxID=10029 RepID=G3IC36_CRIGR|nr:hypothetical protein I79_021224 [Cricetulus griseus]
MYDECPNTSELENDPCFDSACREAAWISLASSLLCLTGPLTEHTVHKGNLTQFSVRGNWKAFSIANVSGV